MVFKCKTIEIISYIIHFNTFSWSISADLSIVIIFFFFFDAATSATFRSILSRKFFETAFFEHFDHG